MPKNPIDQFFEDLERELTKAFKPVDLPEEKEEEEFDRATEAPAFKTAEGTTEEFDSHILAKEAVRILKRAEELAGDTVTSQGISYQNPQSDRLIAIADRYIRLTELVLLHG